jgi:outer membrane biosynthesis protein TonB
MNPRLCLNVALLICIAGAAANAQQQCIRSSKPDLLGLTGGRMTGGALPPRVIYMPEPEYDEASRKAVIQGSVVLWVELDGKGKVKKIRPTDSWGHSLLEPDKCSGNERCPMPPQLIHNAIENVRHWTFEPACKDGHGVPVMINVVVTFTLY